MKNESIFKRLILLEILFLTGLSVVYFYKNKEVHCLASTAAEAGGQAGEFIKWVDFQVTAEALEKAYEYDRDTYGQEVHLNWIELLAYTAARTGGEFSKETLVNSYLEEAAAELSGGKTIEELTEGMKYYGYYLEAYTAVLGGMVGEYEIQVPAKASAGETQGEGEADAAGPLVWEKRYGLKAFLPIAKDFPYSDYDDFGVSRSYGYRRKHLGHDMMGQVGTPIIAVESGFVEALGWNQYGGWRIGIRSFDKKRYYYYAHLRQGFPYALELEEGSRVQAGDVIGYMGHTGYSTKEDVNNIDQTHLHFGIQLIFDESQKEGASEIWIDCYQIVRFLYRNRSACVRNDATKEWHRIYDMREPDDSKEQRGL
ncbi:MAG: M23 family metallopeptidase [Lachnospiraceae bacterium]|uniref:M23 family metallopeptidase n=1 Tax=Candidatus Merdisoma sp. JLR.KK011 TaxID=3114299 RepID=UPI002FEF1409|nr:M23 family metallopeptidase [Lachnospiraceae bacterium]